AVMALDRDFGAAPCNGVLAIDPASGRRRAVIRVEVPDEVLKSETADMAAEDISAREPPDALGCSIEMADVTIAVDDHQGLVRPLNGGEQDIRVVNHGDIVCAHRQTQRLVENPSRPAPVEGVICTESIS